MTKIILIVDVDAELANPGHPSGLSERGRDELESAITQVGTIVGQPERWADFDAPASSAPVPTAPTWAPPVSNEKSRAYNRRRIAIEHASQLARARVGLFDTSDEIGEGIVTIAKKVETYLEGKS